LGQPNVHYRGLAVSQAVVPGVGCGWIIGAVGPSNDREGDRRLNGSRKPTIGVDLGADGARTMMLVYNLPRTDAIYQQFNGIAGAAYFVAGFGMTALTSGDEHMVVVPIRSGLGLRLGYNVGYLKFTTAPTWNPF
jgi:hypothetical protein